MLDNLLKTLLGERINYSFSPGDSSLCISIKSYGSPRISGDLLVALADAFQVTISDIVLEGWYQTVSGCDTCGHGSDGAYSISIDNIPPHADVSANASKVLLNYIVEKEREEKEHKEYLKKQEAARKAKNEANRLHNEKIAADNAAARKQFLDNKSEIFNILWHKVHSSNLDRIAKRAMMNAHPLKTILRMLNGRDDYLDAYDKFLAFVGESKKLQKSLGLWWTSSPRL